MDDNIFDKLKDLTGNLPDKLNILEEQIDINVQMEYFEYSKKIKKEDTIELKDIPNLSNTKLDINDKKRIIVQLSNIDDPKAFNRIKTFLKKAPKELKDWTILALQESRMLLESSLLDENQIYISTGLGGKNNKLRYFIVLIGNNLNEFEDFQKKIILSEFELALKNSNGELEKIIFNKTFATFTALIPFDISLPKLFKSTITECNQYGNFLKQNFIVTNVKVLSTKEIKEFIKKNELPNNNTKFNDYEE